MRSSLIAASALLAAMALACGQALGHPRIQLHHPGSPDGNKGWHLSISKDDFSGDVRCRLRSADDRMIYRPHALGFRFGRHDDVLGAWIRIDDGVPVRWRDMFPELARTRVTMSGRDLASPTDGMIWIPVSLLTHTDGVSIQTRRGKRPRVFHLEDFTSTLEDARAQGCVPEERFVP